MGSLPTKSRLLIALFASAAWVMPVAASAAADAATADQDAPATDQSDTSSGRSDIVVTASKRSERITDVPFAVTAIGQREIRDRGAIDIKDLQYSIPGLNIQELAPGANRTTLRGINPGSGTGLPIVGTYVDEVGISIDQQQRDGSFPLVDIDRIEVLRGPQGTLYGQGSIAGTIRYITRNPSLTDTDGFVEANVYQQSKGDVGYRINGAVGVPIIRDSVGLRISGGYDRLAGWIDYPNVGTSGVQNANVTKRWFVRPKLYAKLSDALTFSLLYQYYDQQTNTDGISGTDYTRRPGRVELYPGSDKSHLINAIFQYDFGPATLTSSTGYQQRDLVFQAPLSVFRALFATEFKQFSQELRLSSNDQGPIQYTGGLWYRTFRSNGDRTLFQAGTNTATTVFRRVGDDPVDSESFAVFGDATWSATDKFDLSLGGRYFYDERRSGSTVPVTTTLNAAFRSFSPRASLKYSWSPEASTYVTVSKGFRSGGFNASGTSFGPESLWNYELGTKARLFGGAVFLDAAVYYADYKDRQAQGLIEASPGIFFTETRNVGKASGFGIEGAINISPGSGFQIDATAAYNDIKSDVTNAEVVKGQRFDFVPAFTASVSLSQRAKLTDTLTGLWRIDYQHSDAYASVTRQGQPNGTVVVLEDFKNGTQDYLNAKVGVEFGNIGIYADVQNILNEKTYLFPFSPIAVNQEGTRPRPTSYGLTLRIGFGK